MSINRRGSRFFPGRAIFIPAALLIFCSGAQPSPNSNSTPINCPADMVWVEAGRFCVDRYEFPNHAGVEPIRGIDYYEAVQLCASRGKRVPTVTEFQMACGGEAKTLLPYGPEYIPNRCRTGLKWADGPSPAGSYPECVNNGIYDLTGNVWEWVNGPSIRQSIAGGAWNTGPDRANCRGIVLLVNLIVAPSVGVRCVSTPKQ